MTIAPNTNNCKPCCPKKAKCSKFIPYEEMERLMRVYGAVKAVRNRGVKSTTKNGEKEVVAVGQVKKESIKRKFYRWFPDLEERFARNEEDGKYHPINGHEQEVKYRKEMREKSFESVAKKRAMSNQRNNYLKKRGRGDEIELFGGNPPLPELTGSSGAPLSLDVSPLTRKSITLEDDAIISSLVSEDEDESSTIDNFFHASRSIFDEVNKEFYGEELLPSVSIDDSSSRCYSDDKTLESVDIISNSSLEEDLELWDGDLFGILEPAVEERSL